MKTKIILHNSVSLDSSFIGFTPDMELHYEVVNFYRAEGYMAGSVTARTGLDMFGTAYRDAFCQLSKNYGIHKILADTGSKLGNILLNEGLVDEISLIISPEITGKDSKYLFGEVKDRIGLSCLECKLLKSGYIWVRYEVKGGDVV